MNQKSYLAPHWQKKVKIYLDSEWSRRGSPFAELAISYLENNSKILELGAGAAQDGIYFASNGHEVVSTDADDTYFDDIKQRANGLDSFSLEKLRLPSGFDYPDNSFDMVYSQLALHYFDDQEMNSIYSEIYRVLKPGGLIAVMTNTKKDEEFSDELSNDQGILSVNGLQKRFFGVDDLRPFVNRFEEVLFDDQGKTPKDDEVSNSGMIRFIGRK